MAESSNGATLDVRDGAFSIVRVAYP